MPNRLWFLPSLLIVPLGCFNPDPVDPLGNGSTGDASTGDGEDTDDAAGLVTT